MGRIAVRPDTVQSAIATLERPARYSRAITIERYYSGGSGVDRSSVSVDGAWMRVDTEQASGAQSHTISNGERTWVWYGGSELYYESAAAFTADEEQGIPTYEDILRLDKKRIAAADYRLLDTVDCIFLETAADDGGYIERYWVSVSDGLLCAAEKLQGEDVVYRMAGHERRQRERGGGRLYAAGRHSAPRKCARRRKPVKETGKGRPKIVLRTAFLSKYVIK